MQVYDGYHDAGLLEEFRQYLAEEFGFQIARVTAMWEENESLWDPTDYFPQILINGIDMDGMVLRGEPVGGDLSDFNEWREDRQW